MSNSVSTKNILVVPVGVFPLCFANFNDSQLWTKYEWTDSLRVVLCKGSLIIQIEVLICSYCSMETWICLFMLLQAILLQYFECKGDSGRKVDIVGGDSIDHCEKVHINICLILSGYRNRAIRISRHNSVRLLFVGLGEKAKFTTTTKKVDTRGRIARCHFWWFFSHKEMRRSTETTSDLRTRVTKWTEFDSEIFEYLLWTATISMQGTCCANIN